MGAKLKANSGIPKAPKAVQVSERQPVKEKFIMDMPIRPKSKIGKAAAATGPDASSLSDLIKTFANQSQHRTKGQRKKLLALGAKLWGGLDGLQKSYERQNIEENTPIAPAVTRSLEEFNERYLRRESSFPYRPPWQAEDKELSDELINAEIAELVEG